MDSLGGSKQTVILDGQTYTLSPITNEDMAEFADHFRNKPIRDFQSLVKVGLVPDDLKSEEYRRILQNVLSDTRGFEELLQEYEHDALYFGLWLRLRPNHPDLSLTTVNKFSLSTVLDNMEAVSTWGLSESVQKKMAEKQTENEAKLAEILQRKKASPKK